MLYGTLLKQIYYSPGSIITTTELVFSYNSTLPTSEEVKNVLVTAVGNATVGPLNINAESITVNSTGKSNSISKILIFIHLRLQL